MSSSSSDGVCEIAEAFDDEVGLINQYLSEYHHQQEREKREIIKLILDKMQSTGPDRERESLMPTNTQFNESTVSNHSIISTASTTMDLKMPTVTISAISSSSSTAWVFTQGLIIGQVSVILLLCAFIKFFVFTEALPIQAPTPKVNIDGVIKSMKRKIDESNGNLTNNNSNSNANIAYSINNNEIDNNINSLEDNENEYDEVIKQILEKTYYDVNKHQAESLDWFNVLIAQIISQARFEALVNDNIYHSINEALNQPQILQYCDRLKLTEVNIGNDYPIFSNCRVKNNEGRLEAKIDVDVADTFTLGIETNLLINQPRLMSACLPIKLSVSLVRFSSCLTVSLITTEKEEDEENDEVKEGMERNDNTTDESATRGENGSANTNNKEKKKKKKRGHSIGLMFAFSPDFRLEFDVKSLIGSKAKLENIPRISSLIENVLRKWFIDRCIEPRFQLIKLPSLWPRKKNTRVNTEEST